MADNTKIQWTDATWNPVRGCSRITPGCGGANHQGGCYAEKIAARFSDPGMPYHGFAKRTPYGGRWTGKLALLEDKLDQPIRWKRPRMVFVNSMSDLLHEALSDADIDRVFDVMERCPQHQFQVLTKRHERMRDYVASRWCGRTPPPHLWFGVSVEDQKRADERVPALLETPAAVRFLSCEPLLGPIDLRNLRCGTFDAMTGCGDRERLGDWGDAPSIDWIIAGAESGPGARPCSVAWIRAIRDQCAGAGVPFYYKQFATLAGKKIPTPVLDGRRWTEFPTTEESHGR